MINTVIEIIKIPLELSNNPNLSFYELVKNSGYPERHNQISVQDFSNSLASHPNYIAVLVDIKDVSILMPLMIALLRTSRKVTEKL